MDKDSGVCYLALVALYLDVNHNLGFFYYAYVS